jgi:hypothetical protein
MSRDTVNQRLKTLEKYNKKHDEEKRAIAAEKERLTATKPTYKDLYSSSVNLDDKVKCDIAYVMTTYPVGNDQYPSGKKTYGFQLRKTYLNGTGIYHGQNRILIKAEKFSEVYDGITDMYLEIFSAEDCIDMFIGISKKLMKKFPREFAMSFMPPETIVNAPLQQKKIEDTNFEKISIKGKQQKPVSDDKRKWISEHL